MSHGLNIKSFIIAFILFFASLVCYSYAALTFPAAFNLDNLDNLAATTYIAKHQRLPVVAHDDPKIVFTPLGTTRSLRPPLTYIVGAAADRLTDGVIEERSRRQRLGAALIGSLTVLVAFIGFVVAYQHYGIAVLGASLVALLPKFLFLSSSNNDDIGAIFSVSVLSTCVLILARSRDKRWALVGLAFAVGLVLQTKFTAWLTLPWFGLLCLLLLRNHWHAVIRVLPIMLVMLVLGGGWWPIFNMINYGFLDPTAINHAVEIQQTLTGITPNRQGYQAQGIGLLDLLTNREQFLMLTYTSMIGYLEWLELSMSSVIYSIYGLVLLLGIMGAVARIFSTRNRITGSQQIDLLLLAMLVSQCVFYIHHNLVRDIQPQARYLLPVLMPMVYLFLRLVAQMPQYALTVSLAQRSYRTQAVVATVAIALVFMAAIDNLRYHILPGFKSGIFFTELRNRTTMSFEDDLSVIASKSIDYTISNSELTIRRTGLSEAYVEFGEKFCRKLPKNALVSFTVESENGGGIRLLLDKHDRGTFPDAYWRSFSGGSNTAIYIIRSSGCSSVRFVLGRNTQSLKISDLAVEDLRVHRYGKPI